jgi:bifunctional UDP-N-acetylglucosamine pyrophosphorylase/glucosamine-1-phosphate N-acetyltransferase
VSPAGELAERRVWFLDLDGTLVDSAPVHEAAFRDAIAELAPDLLGSFRYDDHAGASTREVVARLGAGHGIVERLARRKQQLYRGYVDAGRVAVFPGADRLLDRLARHGRSAYLVTGGSRGSVERVLAACSLHGRFRGVLTGDDVASGKPDPAAYREACRRWAVDPADALAVEDSAHGVAAAVGAGLVTVQVHATVPNAGAIAVPHLDELAELVGGQRTCAVIPAAGRGTRLGPGIPKVMLEIADGVTVWQVLYGRLRPWVEHLHAVVSPAGERPFRRLAAAEIRDRAVSVSVQDEPTGMGDAIFGAARHWVAYEAILVVWGDQANVSPATVSRVLRDHRRTTGAGRPGLTLPLVPMADPYVEYELVAGELRRVRQSREGDECRPGGLSDIGVFCLSTAGLSQAWWRYLAGAAPGAGTGEVNFLPFLPYLSRIHGWPVTVVPVADPVEARGINTRDDLDFARRAYLRCAR